MKVALLGRGKTGGKLLEVKNCEVVAFHRSNPPTYDKLQEFDVIVSFLPGEAFVHTIPLLLEIQKPVVTGSTGFEWPMNFDKTLQEKNLTWIYATNFSLGVVVLKQLIEKLHSIDHLLSERSFKIHEVHHTQKLDAPSGTALSMKQWLNEPCEITSERMGDVVGLHTLSLETPGEVIRIEHEARDRRLFAEGALWAAKYITQNKLKPGLHAFQKVVESHLSL